jgi:uncharacterized protein (TIGR02246 family)
VTQAGRRGVLVGIPGLVASGLAAVAGGDETEDIEEAVLAVSAEMTKAGEALDADRLFGYMLDTDKVSVIQNGVVMTTRREALEQVRGNLRTLVAVRYDWKRQYVTVLSPEVAVLAAEGQSTATTAAGQTFTTPFAQTVVFVRRDGAWRAIHAHQSAPRR